MFDCICVYTYVLFSDQMATIFLNEVAIIFIQQSLVIFKTDLLSIVCLFVSLFVCFAGFKELCTN